MKLQFSLLSHKTPLSILIALTLFLPACSDGIENASAPAQPRPQKSLKDILDDPALPSLYDPASDFERYFELAGRSDWLSNGVYSETAILNINEAQPHLMDRHRTYGIEIKSNAKEHGADLNFSSARDLAIRMLPKTPPIKEEYFRTYPHRSLTFEMVSEQAYLLPDDDMPLVVYSAQFASKQNEPSFPDGDEGELPYREAITIHISRNGIETISIGGSLYFPARLQKSEELEADVLDDELKLKSLL